MLEAACLLDVHNPIASRGSCSCVVVQCREVALPSPSLTWLTYSRSKPVREWLPSLVTMAPFYIIIALLCKIATSIMANQEVVMLSWKLPSNQSCFHGNLSMKWGTWFNFMKPDVKGMHLPFNNYRNILGFATAGNSYEKKKKKKVTVPRQVLRNKEEKK